MSRKQLEAIAKAAGGKTLTIKLPAGVLPAKAKRGPRREMPGHCLLDPVLGRWDVLIPNWHPTPLNRLISSHRRSGRLKWDDALIIGRSLKEAGVPAASTKRRIGLVIILAPGQRGCDGDAYWKSLLDGLQRCRALVGDHRQRCETTPVIYERAEVKATRIILEDVS